MEKFEAGMVLVGSEVKAMREAKVNIKESYIRFMKNELFQTLLFHKKTIFVVEFYIFNIKLFST